MNKEEKLANAIALEPYIGTDYVCDVLVYPQACHYEEARRRLAQASVEIEDQSHDTKGNYLSWQIVLNTKDITPQP